MIKRRKLHSSTPFKVWYCPGGALLILDSHLQNFHPTNHMSISMDFHQFYTYGFQLLSMIQRKLQVIDNRSSFCLDDVHQKPSSSKMFIARECKRVIVHQPSWDVLPAYLTHNYWQKCWEEQSAVSNVDQITAADSLSLGLAWPLLLEKPYFTKELWGRTVYQPNDIWELLCLLWLLYPFQWQTHSPPYWGQCGFPFVPNVLGQP